MSRRKTMPTLFPYTTLFRSVVEPVQEAHARTPLRARWRATYLPITSTSRLRSEEHTSELQSRRDIVCRLLLEKKNNNYFKATWMPDRTEANPNELTHADARY